MDRKGTGIGVCQRLMLLCSRGWAQLGLRHSSQRDWKCRPGFTGALGILLIHVSLSVSSLARQELAVTTFESAGAVSGLGHVRVVVWF